MKRFYEKPLFDIILVDFIDCATTSDGGNETVDTSPEGGGVGGDGDDFDFDF